MDFQVVPVEDGSTPAPQQTVQERVPVRRKGKSRSEIYPLIILGMMAGRMYENPSTQVNIESYIKSAKLLAGAKEELSAQFEALIHASKEQKDKVMGAIVAILGNEIA